uniref:Uncharacterized protein n=1 Tax=Ananas comosus var. bracteatus TaxID=296719 RepID=A0A6V7Q4E1_ANACO|nr:unnamed protein product [Ananas comosus var. bracteatus]
MHNLTTHYEEEGFVNYVGGSSRLNFIRQGDNFKSLQAMFCKYINTSQDSCNIEIKLCYSENLSKLIDIVDDDDVGNMRRLYKVHAYLMELYAVSNLVERKFATCDPDDIDEVLTDEQLDLLINRRSGNASTPQQTNFEIVGS